MDRKTAEGLMNKLTALPSGCKIKWPWNYAYTIKDIYLMVPNNSKKYSYYILHTEEKLKGENERRIHLLFFRGPYAASRIGAAYVNFTSLEEFDHTSFRTSSVDHIFVRQRIREAVFNILVDRFWQWEYATLPQGYNPDKLKVEISQTINTPHFIDSEEGKIGVLHESTPKQVVYKIIDDKTIYVETTGPGLMMYKTVDVKYNEQTLAMVATVGHLLSVLRTEDKMRERRRKAKLNL